MRFCKEYLFITPEIIQILKSSQNSKIGAKDEDGMTALMYLCYNTSITPELIRELKDEIGIQNAEGRTALMCLCTNEAITLELIRELKDEIGLQNKNGCTALIFLCGNLSITLKLIQELKDEIALQNDVIYVSLKHLNAINISSELRDDIKTYIGNF